MKPISEEALFEDFSLDEQAQYDAFVRWCEGTDYGRIIAEGFLSDKVTQVLSFAKEVAKSAKLKVSQILIGLRDKRVFKIFSMIGFSIKKLWEYAKKAYEAWAKIVHFLPDLLTDLAAKGIDLASRHFDPNGNLVNVFKSIEKWLSEHRAVLIVSGIVLGVLLILIWCNMSFVGDPQYDFDFDTILNSFTGRFTFVDFLTSKDGLKTLILLATGMMGLSFPWFGQITFLVALVHFIGKKLHLKFSGKEPPEEELVKGIQANL